MRADIANFKPKEKNSKYHLILQGTQVYWICIWSYSYIKTTKSMKLVSVNAVLIASGNISLFVNSYIDQTTLPPITLFSLSLIYIALIILLEYEHRQFKQS